MTDTSTTQTETIPYDRYHGPAFLSKWIAAGRVQGLTWTDRFSHWGLRIPLAGILFYNSSYKFPDVFYAPGDHGVPAIFFILTAFGELLSAIALILGGVIETWRPGRGLARLFGDAITRMAGLAGTIILISIIYVLFGGVPYNDPHWLIFGASVYFLLRGSNYGDLK
ncbi:MAG: hypothetical protein AAF641_03970 [Pseudomonadota bacterium]